MCLCASQVTAKALGQLMRERGRELLKLDHYIDQSSPAGGRKICISKDNMHLSISLEFDDDDET